MANLILPSRFTSQPQYPAPIAPEFRRAMASCWPIAQFPMGQQVGTPLTFSATLPTPFVNRLGRGREFATLHYALGPASTKQILTSDGAGTGDFTALVIDSSASSTSVRALITQRSDTAAAYSQFDIAANTNAYGNTTAGYLSFRTYSTADTRCGAAGLVDGLPHVRIGVRRGTTMELWQDGVLVASTSGTARAIAAADSRFGVGIAAPSYNNAGAYPLTLAATWDRAFTATEAASVSRNPWQIFQAPSRRLYMSQAGAATFNAGWAQRRSRVIGAGAY